MQDEKYADLVWDHDEVAHKKFIENLAPIVLFTYNRLEHTQKTIEALQKNVYAQESELYIYSDGPKNEAATEAVKSVREILHQVDGFKQVHIVERANNWGLAENIIDGVTSIVNEYGKIIVLEDDIVTSKYFLKYMNDALEVYKEIPKVMAVSGYCWPPDKESLSETFFLPWFSCWGWATWNRSWNYYKRNPEELIKNGFDTNTKEFNINGAYDFWKQVEQNYSGELYTWAVFFCVAIFQRQGLVAYCNHDQCKNVGNDGTGVDCGKNNYFNREILVDKETRLFNLNVHSDAIAEDVTTRFFLRIKESGNLFDKVLNVYKNEGIKGVSQRLWRKLIQK